MLEVRGRDPEKWEERSALTQDMIVLWSANGGGTSGSLLFCCFVCVCGRGAQKARETEFGSVGRATR